MKNKTREYNSWGIYMATRLCYIRGIELDRVSNWFRARSQVLLPFGRVPTFLPTRSMCLKRVRGGASDLLDVGCGAFPITVCLAPILFGEVLTIARCCLLSCLQSAAKQFVRPIHC